MPNTTCALLNLKMTLPEIRPTKKQPNATDSIMLAPYSVMCHWLPRANVIAAGKRDASHNGRAGEYRLSLT